MLPRRLFFSDVASFRVVRTLAAIIAVLSACALSACDKSESGSKTWHDVCVDLDNDGYGFQCSAGDDCDDSNSEVHTGCGACSPADGEGCACPSEGETASCTVSRSVTDAGALACEIGTRTCRKGAWSTCEQVTVREASPESLLRYRAIIDLDAAPRSCDPCHPNCYRVDDPLAATDGSVGEYVVTTSSGGVTLYAEIPDGGVALPVDSGPQACVPGIAPDSDCDGIPDVFDPYPSTPPFASTHQTIFLDLEPGKTKSGDIDIRFNLNTADIYLYVDMTGSMDGERTNLLGSFQTGNYLPDGGVGVECADRNQNGSTADEEPLKNQGIVGNLACIVRDSWVGAGWHRDLPFSELDTAGFAYGPDDFELYQNEVDLTSSVTDVVAGLNRFHTRGGINRPEGGILGLHLIATGQELYSGWNRPGNPARLDCPADRWGYPCFRKDAVPIVIWVTDAPLTNGPPTIENTLGPEPSWFFTSTSTNQPMNWGIANTRIDTGTSSAYFQVANTNNTYATALDIGGINETFRTYTGDSTLLTANMTTALAGACVGGTTRVKGPAAWDTTAEGAPDAFFKFHVDVAEPLIISTRGGHVKSSLAIVDAARMNTTSASATATNANNTGATALSMGSIDPLVKTYVVSGTTTSGTALLSRDVFGSCLAQNTASSDKVAAGVVKFQLAHDLPGGLRMTGDGNYAIAAAVYAGPPGGPTDTALTGINVVPSPSSTAATTGGNANDVFDSYSIGDVVGRYVRLTAGTTSSPNLTSNFASSFFTASPACSAVNGNGVDAVVDFTLSAATRVRIEGTGLNATLQAGFDHVIALVPRTSVSHTAASGNYTDATAQAITLTDVPAAATGGAEYTGVLGGTPSDYLQTEVGPFATATAATACTNAAAAASTAYQAVMVMDVTASTAGTYDFETAGSGVSNWLSLHRTIADTQQLAVPSNPMNAGQVQDLGTVEDRSVFAQAASMVGHGAAAADFVVRGTMGCAASPLANGGADAIYTFRVASARQVQVGAVGGATSNYPSNPGNPGFDSHVAVFAGAVAPANLIAGGCDNPSGNAYTTAAFNALPGITYYAVVKHQSTTTTTLTGTTAAYSVWVRDVNFANNFVACNYGSQVSYPTTIRAARITATLTAGRYYLVVKGATNGAAYKLNVRRNTSSTPSLLACDRNSGGALHSVIEQTLAAGKYAVIIRGLSTSDVGAYNLTIRDTAFSAVPMACSYDGNTGTPASILTGALPALRNGTPIDYYAAVRGNTATGAYTMYLENGAFQPTQCAYDNAFMTHNDPNTGTVRFTTDYNNGEWTGTLQPGDYYAIMKGEDQTDVLTNTEDDDYGRYQLSIGDAANHVGVADFGQKLWLGPAGDGVGGVRQELLDRKIRVVTVDSTRGPNDTVAGTNDPYYSNQQMQSVARETNAKHADGTPLFYTINSDGTGLGTAIVTGVQEVSGNLAMNVTARLVEDPDRPSPHFLFTVEAVDMPGDSCDPPIDTDHDAAHIPDTHVACRAGATPKFRVTFTNPLSPSIADNPNDPLGGYNMRVELIGDNQFVVDKVPVYIIPENLIADPGDALFAPVGRYVQDSNSSGCAGTEAPVWTTLSWEDAMPRNTSLGWEICTADSLAALDMCSYRTLATVTRGAACTTSATCPNGYCTAGGYCEYVVGPACTTASDCGLNGVCAANRCAWTQNPIDLKSVLTGGAQGKHFLRTRLTMNANSTRTQAPTVYSWGVKYTCTPQE